MNILVTGATGFIGRHLVKELAKTGDTVFCLIRSRQRAKVLDGTNVRCIHGDITDPRSLDSIEETIDVVFHCAAVVSNKNAKRLYDVNVLGTRNVCAYALHKGVRRLIYTSSIACVSGHDAAPYVESLPYKPNNPYGESKIAAEKIVIEYRAKGVATAVLRPCMVYGEDEPHLLKLFALCVKWGLLPVVGGGTNKFHLGYVGNVVAALVHALKDDRMLEGTFFIADEEVLTNKQVLEIMARALDARKPRELSPALTNAILKLPYIGRKVNNLLKNREYSQARIREAGFRHPYRAEPSLARSCREVVRT